MQKVVLTNECVKILGRTYQIEDTLWMGLSGTGVEFSFSGMSLVVSIEGAVVALDEAQRENAPRVAIYLDDERIVDDLITQKEMKYVVFDGTKERKGIVKIIKLSESPMSVMGIKPLEIGDMDWIQPTENKEHFIEIIGDSITCGYGVDDEDCMHHFKTETEDCTKSYSLKTAAKLNVDVSLVSASGYGIISGYTDHPENKNVAEVLPPYYESLGYSRDLFAETVVPHSLTWNFAGERQPDLVIVNLGTNDDSYCQDDEEKQKDYRTNYIEFLKVIRKNNKNAKILCVLGLMGARLFPVICNAVEMYTQETADTNISTLLLPEQNPEEGYAADYHPIEKAHEKASRVLVQGIRELMKW